MTAENVLEKIAGIGIVPVVRAESYEHGCHAVEALYAGGIPIVEITMTVPDAPSVIESAIRKFGDRVVVGAGTVLSADHAQRCLDAGASFLVSPGLSVPVLHLAKRHKVLAIPGALTPSEIISALAEGASVIKIFPCGNVGGPAYLKSLMGPFPQVSFIPTGGVNASNAIQYFAAGAFAVGVGSDLVSSKALQAGTPEKITRAAQELVEIVRQARLAPELH
jgi:2-dehydro-3-deoxyphosphogluconate aldolase/(4S)-4-hydroxy-2-oxoglutarate aldolase